jgi:hypothetical protein
MRRSDHPSRPSESICCCVVWSKTLLMPATEPAFRGGINVSTAIANGRFSAVDQWPVLRVHRGRSHGRSRFTRFYVSGDNRGHLAQRGTPETMSARRQPTPLVIREPQPSAAQLGPQDPILFHEIPDHILLLLTQPAGEGGEEELKRGHVNHGGARVPHR